MVRHREHSRPILLSAPPSPARKWVLVVVTGEVDHPEKVLSAMPPSVGEIGKTTIAMPVEHEVAGRVHGLGEPPTMSETLDRITNAFAEPSPECIMLPGLLDEAIPTGVSETIPDLVLIVGSESSTVAPRVEDQLDVEVIRAVAPAGPESDSS